MLELQSCAKIRVGKIFLEVLIKGRLSATDSILLNTWPTFSAIRLLRVIHHTFSLQNLTDYSSQPLLGITGT